MSTLRRSNLLSPEQVAVAAEIATRFDAVGVAKELILREWLTEWQARQLLAGKSKLFLGRYKLMDVLGQGGYRTEVSDAIGPQSVEQGRTEQVIGPPPCDALKSGLSPHGRRACPAACRKPRWA